MRWKRTTILAGGAALLAAGTAAAAEELHTMNVALPDGSVARIEYTGEIAPKVTIVPSGARTVIVYDPFAGFDRMIAAMEARHRAMMLQMAALEEAAAEAAAGGQPGLVTVSGGLPAGVHYSYVSSTTDANGCTRTVEYRSDGSDQAPKVTRTSAGNCDSVESEAPAVQLTAGTPAQAQPRQEV